MVILDIFLRHHRILMDIFLRLKIIIKILNNLPDDIVRYIRMMPPLLADQLVWTF